MGENVYYLFLVNLLCLQRRITKKINSNDYAANF